MTRRHDPGPSVRVIELDHLAYITDRAYRRRFHLQVRALTKRPGPYLERVWHEPHDECCALEPWPQTFDRIIKALNMDGLKSLGVRVREAEA